MSKYTRTIRAEAIDVYDVLTAFEVRNPAVQHAVNFAGCPPIALINCENVSIKEQAARCFQHRRGSNHNERLERPMAKRPLPSPEVLRQLLRYDPETGKLFWRQRDDAPRKWNVRFTGREAFTSVTTYGYRQGTVNGCGGYKAHRVAWAIYHGAWPPMEVDHIDGDRQNNRIDNLRLATSSQNKFNRTVNPKSRSGLKGVEFDPRDGRFYAKIMANGRRHYLGCFANAEEAKFAYDRAAKSLHGDFARP